MSAESRRHLINFDKSVLGGSIQRYLHRLQDAERRFLHWYDENYSEIGAGMGPAVCLVVGTLGYGWFTWPGMHASSLVLPADHLLSSVTAESTRPAISLSEVFLSGERYQLIAAHPAQGDAEALIGEVSGEDDIAEPDWLKYQVEKGDTLSRIFSKLDLDTQTMYRLLSVEGKEKPLTRIRPGQMIDYQLDEQGELLGLQVKFDRKSRWLFSVNQDGEFSREVLQLEGEMIRRQANGVIAGSFWESAREAGLGAGQIEHFSTIFQWKLDFSRDLRKGDIFSVLYDAEFIDGEATGRSQILAASLTNNGHDYMVFRHKDGSYYDIDGNATSNAFLRYPLDGTYRIRSHFQKSRLHPVLGVEKKHNGTDFAVPTGTPVLAAGTGVVVKSAYNRFNGNYVVLRHNNNYQTIYLHLSKRLVTPGQQVQLGERIALSGNTGRSTGPHLHYEFHVNGRPVDAMKVKLQMAPKLADDELLTFREQVQPLLAQLEQSRDLLLAAR